MTDYCVIAVGVNYSVPAEDETTVNELSRRMTATRGDIVDFCDSEAERLLALGVIVEVTDPPSDAQVLAQQRAEGITT